MSTHPKGVYEKVKGSGIWWVRYADAGGRRRREKAGTKGMALMLYRKRKTEAVQGKKLPETLRRRSVLFEELIQDALTYGGEHHQRNRVSDSRAAVLGAALGSRPADAVTPQEIEAVLSRLATERNWQPGTRNRHQAFISLAYRLGVENGKLAVNPARLVRRKRESSGRILWLTADQELKLTAVIEQRFPAELPALRLALHTGMRRSEQYRLTWDCVDFERRQITIPKTKNGSIRERQHPLRAPGRYRYGGAVGAAGPWHGLGAGDGGCGFRPRLRSRARPENAPRMVCRRLQAGRDAGVHLALPAAQLCFPAGDGGSPAAHRARIDGAQNHRHDLPVRPSRTPAHLGHGAAAGRLGQGRAGPGGGGWPDANSHQKSHRRF